MIIRRKKVNRTNSVHTDWSINKVTTLRKSHKTGKSVKPYEKWQNGVNLS